MIFMLVSCNEKEPNSLWKSATYLEDTTFGNGSNQGYTCLGEVQMFAVTDTVTVYSRSVSSMTSGVSSMLSMTRLSSE